MGTSINKAIIWGGTGQARVAYQILKSLSINLSCVCDRDAEVSTPVPGVPIWHTEKDFLAWLDTTNRQDLCFVAAIGGSGGASRLVVHAYLSKMEIRAVTITHPSAWVDGTASVGSGSQILAMAAVGVDVALGKQCIVNTNATIDHSTRVGDGVHVMPGATVAGQVVIGNEAVIGSNATILPRLRVGTGAVVGAGAVVTHDVEDWKTVVGVPARPTAGRRDRPLRNQSPWVSS